MNDSINVATFPSRVLIVGLGETGVAAARWCVRQGARVRVADTRVAPAGLEVENTKNYLTPFGFAHNGGGKRKGSIAVYLEPWHGDIFDFLELRKNQGKEELRSRDLFLAMWIP